MTQDQIDAAVKTQATDQQKTVQELIGVLDGLHLAQADVDKVATLTARLKHETDAILTALATKPDVISEGGATTKGSHATAKESEKKAEPKHPH